MRWAMALATLGVLAALPAGAQGMLGRSGAARPSEEAAPARPPIPGLPGLMGRQRVAPIPAETPPSGMNPNDALFDGINRGDIATVRDAIARGADAGARNALGLTALDSAVDQGRPEITFYLLSVRGASTNATPPSQEPAPRAAGRQRAGRELPVREAPERRAEAAPPNAPQLPPQLPPLWANNGGSPMPELGFLGFDAGRPEGARPEGSPQRTSRRG